MYKNHIDISEDTYQQKIKYTTLQNFKDQKSNNMTLAVFVFTRESPN